MNKRLVSKGSVVSHRWGEETLKLGLKQVDMDQIFIMKK